MFPATFPDDPIPVIFEMETSDPDDFMTLLWLADHPGVNLVGVMVTPGSRDQCQLVRWGLDLCGAVGVPIGALHGTGWWSTSDGSKPRVSSFHYKVYGNDILGHPVEDVYDGPKTMEGLVGPGVTVLVGSAPKNTGAVVRDFPGTTIDRWIQQGGFAGDNLVQSPLEKFKGRLTCPSFNPGGAPKETMLLLESPRVKRRIFVSKNVCHGVVWTREMHDLLLSRISNEERIGLSTMIMALDRYLQDKGVGKAMHDLVAAACVMDEGVCGLEEVDIYREKGEWGARKKPGSKTWISVSHDMAKFVDVLAGRT